MVKIMIRRIIRLLYVCLFMGLPYKYTVYEINRHEKSLITIIYLFVRPQKYHCFIYDTFLKRMICVSVVHHVTRKKMAFSFQTKHKTSVQFLVKDYEEFGKLRASTLETTYRLENIILMCLNK